MDWGHVPGCKISADEENENRLEVGDIVFARTGATTGKSFLIRHAPRAVFASYLIRLRASREILPEYLAAFCQSQLYWHQINGAVRGAAQGGVNSTTLSSLLLPLPPLSEQQRIAWQLEQADRLRRTRRYALELSDTFLPAAFLQLFGDPVRNTKDWPIECVDELGKVTTGGTPPSEKPGMFGGSIPFLTPGDLESNAPQPARWVTGEGAAESTTVRAGATMVCCIGATIGKTDRARFRSAFNQQINAIEWGSRIDDAFGLHLMRFFAEVVAKRGRSTTLPILKKSSFAEIRVPAPPLSLQMCFAKLVTRHERLRTVQRESLRQAEHLFQTLLHRAFTGDH